MLHIGQRMRATTSGARCGRLATNRGFFFVDFGGGALGITRAGTPPVRFFRVCLGTYFPFLEIILSL
jgi:hypothetical protein